MSKVKDAAVVGVQEYLERQNRPYSAADIFNNLHKEFGKTAIQKALEQLVRDEMIREKSYGKQKVYIPDQNRLPTLDEKDLKLLDANIAQLSDELSGVHKLVKVAEGGLATLSSSMTTDEIREEVAKLSEENASLKKRLHELANHPNQVSSEERAKLVTQHETMKKEWRKRKRIAVDIINAVLEGYPKSKKAFLEEVGVETDEDAGLPSAASE